ncbi:hypothetical protein BKI52_35495 [marine bacterium AO1-C]|nr:hypothetical protein BKI52_35495 [marine bacterium AO1-C]
MKVLYNFFITNFRKSEDQQKLTKPRLLLHFQLIAILFNIVYAFVCWLITYTPAFYLNLILASTFSLSLLFFRTSISLRIITHLFIGGCLLGLIGFSYLSGGIYSIVLPWFSFIPVISFLLLDLKSGFIWLIISILIIGAFVVIGETTSYLPNQWRFVYTSFLNIGLAIIIAWVTSLFSKTKDKSQALLKDQNLELKIQGEEMLVQNEELVQQREEIIAQRDFIEAKNREMQFLNNKLGSSEKVLRKAVLSLKDSQKKIQEKNIELEQRDKFIQKSIQSAVTIQEAILPYRQKLDELLKDYFIIYRPKDKVSGDFYWLNKIENKTILIAADCTGHGVPGAFMTMIGNTLLDKIIRVWHITDPAAVLERLHTEIQIVLRQNETNSVNGMDAVIITLEKANNEEIKVTFAGAKNPLYYLATNTSEIIEIPGARKSIGGIQDPSKHFINHIVHLPLKSMLYLGSDGLQDQNDKRRKKFGKKRLIQLLNEIAPLPLPQQRQVIEANLSNQLQETTQRDDILWIGIKLQP